MVAVAGTLDGWTPTVAFLKGPAAPKTQFVKTSESESDVLFWVPLGPVRRNARVERLLVGSLLHRPVSKTHFPLEIEAVTIYERKVLVLGGGDIRPVDNSKPSSPMDAIAVISNQFLFVDCATHTRGRCFGAWVESCD